MKARSLGKDGPAVGAIGYGAMGLEGYYGESGDEQGVAALRYAIDAGMMIDTADAYGNGHNESLVGLAVRDRAERPLVATKFGIVFEKGESFTERLTGWGFSLRLNGRPEYARRALDASLGRLGVDAVDLWYLHWTDPSTPIEESVGAMAESVRVGKVRHLGLSNPTAAEVRRAAAVHPIAAVQWEYSLWRREVEAELMPTLRELGIALVAWAPLGAGFLTGTVAEVGARDFRQYNPRFAAENLVRNRERHAPFVALAGELGVTAAQLSLAWLLHRGQDVIPIPGTRRCERIDENAHAASIVLDAATMERIERLAPPGVASGGTIV